MGNAKQNKTRARKKLMVVHQLWGNQEARKLRRVVIRVGILRYVKNIPRVKLLAASPRDVTLDVITSNNYVLA